MKKTSTPLTSECLDNFAKHGLEASLRGGRSSNKRSPRRHPRIKHLQFTPRGQGDVVDQLHDEPHLLADLDPVGGLDRLPVALGKPRGSHHPEDAGAGSFLVILESAHLLEQRAVHVQGGERNSRPFLPNTISCFHRPSTSVKRSQARRMGSAAPSGWRNRPSGSGSAACSGCTARCRRSRPARPPGCMGCPGHRQSPGCRNRENGDRPRSAHIRRPAPPVRCGRTRSRPGSGTPVRCAAAALALPPRTPAGRPAVAAAGRSGHGAARTRPARRAPRGNRAGTKAGNGSAARHRPRGWPRSCGTAKTAARCRSGCAARTPPAGDRETPRRGRSPCDDAAYSRPAPTGDADPRPLAMHEGGFHRLGTVIDVYLELVAAGAAGGRLVMGNALESRGR